MDLSDEEINLNPQISEKVEIPQGNLCDQMEKDFAKNELLRAILEELQHYVDFQILPLAESLTTLDILKLLSAMKEK